MGNSFSNTFGVCRLEGGESWVGTKSQNTTWIWSCAMYTPKKRSLRVPFFFFKETGLKQSEF